MVSVYRFAREEVRNSILGYPSLKNKNFGTFLGEIHRINPEILGYPRIPGYPLTTSLHFSSMKKFSFGLFLMEHISVFQPNDPKTMNFFIITESFTLAVSSKVVSMHT